MARPPKFTSPEQLQKIIDEYFKDCKETNTPLTIEMLCWRLGTQRETLSDYEEKEEFSDTIKDAKQYIRATKVEKLNMQGSNTAGIIFDLCNNGKYSNKHNDSDKGVVINVIDKTKEVLND